MNTFSVETIDGAVLQARRQGVGRPLVLVSGLGGTAAFWDATATALTGEAEIVTFDQRGIGASTRGTAPVSIDQLARDVLAVCDAAGIHRAALLGHSTGGAIVQTIATGTPERVERLALSAAWAGPGHYLKALFEFRLGLLDRDPVAYAQSAALLSHAPAWLEGNWKVYENAVANAPVDEGRRAIIRERIQALLAFDGFAGLDAIQAPTTIIGADDDMIVPAFLQRDLAARLNRSRTRFLPDGGHFYPRTRTEAFVEIVREWLT